MSSRVVGSPDDLPLAAHGLIVHAAVRVASPPVETRSGHGDDRRLSSWQGLGAKALRRNYAGSVLQCVMNRGIGKTGIEH